MARLFLILLMFVSVAARAMPLDLSNALYTTSAFAEVGDDSDGIHADSSPPTALPAFSHAEQLGSDASVHEVATADAIADDGLLSIATEAQGNLQHAGAVAEASFATTLMTPGSYRLALDFDSLLDLAGGEAGAALGLSISVGSSTLFDELFTSSATITRNFTLAPGELGVLQVSLLGNADGFGDHGGVDLYAFNLASVNIALTAVPSPSPLALLGAALPALVRLRRARRV
jgi:hypothetical protein